MPWRRLAKLDKTQICYDEATIAEYLRVFCAPGGMRAGLAFYRAAARSAEQNRAFARERQLAMPILGLSADKGSIPDIAASLSAFAANVRGQTITHCGHFQPEEQPEAVADALLSFLGQTCGARSLGLKAGQANAGDVSISE